MQGLSWPDSVDPSVAFMAGAWLFLAVILVVVIWALLRSERGRTEVAAAITQLGGVSERLAGAQANLQGRVEQTQAGFNERLDKLTLRLSDGLFEHGERTGQTLRALHERLAVIDAAQKNMSQLSQQVVGLQDILSNKQARGAFGEVQLRDLVGAVLPPSAYAFQVTLANRSRVDCLLRLPDPPGPMAIDAKFPLESYRALREPGDEAARTRAARQFAADVGKHVRDIEEKYIVPGETADSAIMFLPSEAVYAELHAGFRNVVEDAFRRKVWIVSPTTLWATLNTLRAVLRDVHLREQASVIQAELRALADDVGRLDDRVAKLQRHFELAVDDVRHIRTAADKVVVRADRLDLIQPSPAEAKPMAPIVPAADAGARVAVTGD
jgi:DNA recombination protein RmuC